VGSLIEDAQRKVEFSAQYFPFTREICTRFSREERIQVIEMLWTVTYADGVLDPEEDMLIRRIAGLIHVPDRERMIARQRALAKTAALRAAPIVHMFAFGQEQPSRQFIDVVSSLPRRGRLTLLD
jgi:tellurite resistance protein TerB